MADGVTIRVAEGCAPDFNLLWDSVWAADLGLADWALAGTDEPANYGGLQAKHAIETAVVLALFTDKRVPQNHPLGYLADGDVRGYFGDGIDVRADLFEAELGSLLWLLERAPLTVRGEPITQWAEQFANEALKPLLDQGVAVRIDVAAVANPLRSRLELTVQLYGRDGLRSYDRKFDLLWKQVTG
jgi:phage gp46-like protein